MPIVYIPMPTKEEPMTRLQRIRLVLEALAKQLGVLTCEKEKSWLMRTFGKILFFNRGFMEFYITTVGSTVYFPKLLLEDDMVYCQVMPHELVHATDLKKRKHWNILYLMPQLLSLLSFFAFFAVINSWNLLWLFSVLFLLPFPSYWRKKVEMRGYAMTLAVTEWWYSEEGEKYQDCPPPYMHRYFTGPDYYFMWPFKKEIEAELQMWLERVYNDELQQHIEIADDIKKIFRGV